MMISNSISEKTYSPQIDGLRGIAIMMILLHHCFGTYFSFLWIGVDLFFVLSGFLITRILINSLSSKNYFFNFYFRRILRIFPLYYFVLLIVFILIPILTELDISYLLKNQLYYWLYIENWSIYHDSWPKGVNIILSHFWSLAIEEQYYLFWPLIIFLFKNKISNVTILIFFFIAISICIRLFGGLADPAYYVATYTRMDGLLIGSLIAVLAIVNSQKVNQYVLIFFYVSISILVLSLFLPYKLGYSNPFFKTIGYTIVAIFFGSVVILSFVENSFFSKFLTKKFLLFFGKYSYGLYVFHFPIFWLLRTPLFDFFKGFDIDFSLSKLITSIIVVVLSILLSMISFVFLEKPFLGMKKYFE